VVGDLDMADDGLEMRFWYLTTTVIYIRLPSASKNEVTPASFCNVLMDLLTRST